MTNEVAETVDSGQAPHPGNRWMPRWNLGDLIDPPVFTRRNWFMLLGPGLLMGGAAIGGGEWLMGPRVTAKYGGGLMWLATLSIIGQVIYNIEISRYTLYTGEPIFTGKFRMPPHPYFWVVAYLFLDFGAIFPYLAANAATPLAAIILRRIPDPATDMVLLRGLAYGIFLAAMVPLVFGGKIYNALKAIMTFKIFVVVGFLLVLGLFYSHAATWTEIFSGFGKFGNVPIRRNEDLNGNGRLDPGEDWDRDDHLDVKEPSLLVVLDSDGDWKKDSLDLNEDGQPDPTVNVGTLEAPEFWPDINQDGEPDTTVLVDTNGDGVPNQEFPVDGDGDGKPDRFIDIDGDGIRDGDNLENVITATIQGRKFPRIDWTMIAFLSALVAISGSGGLSNTPISNYTRDQGWGMGHHVGAIPSVVGGRHLQLSHVGTVFAVTKDSLTRWKGWYRHVQRDQLAVWLPACFLGLALPSMLSVEFLPRGTDVDNQWVTATMTADAVQTRVGGTVGLVFWFMTLFCGFLVLAPSMATTADGLVRRWVDAFWTASGTLRELPPQAIRYVYFGVLSIYATFGMIMLSLQQPETLLIIATTIYNFALGFSCWHTVWLNSVLLPHELRPHWLVRVALILAGTFFLAIATVSALDKCGALYSV